MKAFRGAPAATRIFRNDLVATFVSRPNRYLVRAAVGGRRLDVYCPNPGRLEELLEPGTRLYLEHAGGDGRRTRYTLGACRHPRSGEVIPLYATRSNVLARHLVLPALFPDATAIRAEAVLGASRIDFAVGHRGRPPEFVEVKTCTLVEHGVAMFPDAPTTRGLRHVEELASLGGRGHVLFVLMGAGALRMVPNVHTDPAFAFGLARLQGRLCLHAVTVGATEAGRARILRSDVPVDLAPIRRLVDAGMREDRVGGAYLLRVALRSSRKTAVGGLGQGVFPAGSYVYVGSAMNGLGARISRHKRRRKKAHWHIDHLTAVADEVVGYPVVSARRLECELARELGRRALPALRGFGSSDCDCPTHLFRLPDGEAGRRALLEVVLRYRHAVAL